MPGSASRLSLALDDGLVRLPEDGLIAVLRPPISDALDDLPRDRTLVVTGFRPEFDHFQAAGWTCAPDLPQAAALCIVHLPRSKALGRDLLARAQAIGGGAPVVLDGLKSHGVDSMIRALRKAGAEVSPALSKAHGKLVVFRGGSLDGWLAADLTLPSGHVTRAGAFSEGGIDRGSALLADALPAKLPGRIADLGAGWGYLADRILARPEVTECHLVEAEHQALEAARRNITDPRAAFHWADVTRFADAEGFDHIVTNPPFHASRAADPGLGRAFIEAAARLLKPKGHLWLVANRHLPYESALRQNFREVVELDGDAAFKLYHASRPAPART